MSLLNLPPRDLSIRNLLPYLALAIGAVAMGASPIFVRIADIHPFASAFLRLSLALPVLLAISMFDVGLSVKDQDKRSDYGLKQRNNIILIIISGAFFAGDLFCWHLSIMLTSVANSTFFATLSPLWVALGSGIILGEFIPGRVYYGLLICILGGVAISGASMELAYGSLSGDLLGLATSFFLGGYLLVMRRLRRTLRASLAIFSSTVVSALILGGLVILTGVSVFPLTLLGWLAVLGLAILSQVGGQGLAAYAIGHLPASFASLIIFIEAVPAATLGWLVLGEGLALLQYIGGILIMFGIYVARPRKSSVQPG